MGLLLLTVPLAVSPDVRGRLGRIRPALRAGRLRPWQLLGGCFGGVFVACQTYAVPLVGVTAFLIAVIGGQAVSALAVDRWGIGAGGRHPLSWPRVAAAALAVLGVAVAASAPGRGGAGTAVGAALVVPVAVVFAAGCGQAVQQAVNGLVTTVAGDPIPTAWLNFLTGTVVLVLLAAARGLAGQPLGAPPGADPAPWWAWAGPVVGVAYIVLASWAMQHLPVLAFVLVTTTTQLLTGVVLDLLDPQATALAPQLLLGVGMALTAAAWGALARRRSPGAPPVAAR